MWLRVWILVGLTGFWADKRGAKWNCNRSCSRLRDRGGEERRKGRGREEENQTGLVDLELEKRSTPYRVLAPDFGTCFTKLGCADQRFLVSQCLN